MTTNYNPCSTTAQPRWLHSPDTRQPESFIELHHLAYHQPSVGDYCDDDPQTITPTTPMVLTTPDLVGLTCAVVPAEAMAVSPSPVPYVSRVDAPSFLPYNFAIPDHLLAKDKTPDRQAATTRSEPQLPITSPTSPEAYVGQADSDSAFKVPQSVVSAIEAASSLAPASTTRGRAKKTKKAPSPKREPAAKAAARPRQGSAPRPTAAASVKPVPSAPAASTTSPQVMGECLVPEVHKDDPKQGWEKIMQSVDTQDAKLQRNKWWWYLLAEKNRVTMHGGGMAGAGPDLEKAQGAAEWAAAISSRSPSSSPMQRSPGAAGVESSPQLLQLHELSIYSASEDEGGDDDYQPHDAHDHNNDDDEDDDDWQPTRAKPSPASSRKRTTSNRRSAGVGHPVGEEEEEEAVQAEPSAAKGTRGQDQPEAGSLAGCSSPPKRRRVGSISGGAGPKAPGQVVMAQQNLSGPPAVEGEPVARKLPPRSRLKGLIEWMKSSGDLPPGGPHPPC